jgi:hypothetical protein
MHSVGVKKGTEEQGFLGETRRMHSVGVEKGTELHG